MKNFFTPAIQSAHAFRIFLIVLFSQASAADFQTPLPKTHSGQIVRYADFRSAFVMARTIDVWLPEGYSREKRYPVLYMHDGQMLFDSTHTWSHQEWGVDETLGSLMKEGKIKECIVVGIWNTGNHRYGDYFPEKPFVSLPEAARKKVLALGDTFAHRKFLDGKPNSDNYLKFLVLELKPFIDRTFSTLKNRKNTLIAGSSMGGLISLYALCEYPGVFGAAACLSTHWPGIFRNHDNPVPPAFTRYIESKIPSSATHRLYFDYGTTTLDSLYESHQLRINQILKNKGFSQEKGNFVCIKSEGENHSENAWRKRFRYPATFLLKP